MTRAAVCGIALLWACLSCGFSLAAETPRTLQGRLEIVQEEDFETGRTKQLHFLHEAATGKIYRLAYKGQQIESFVSGTKVSVLGFLLDDGKTIRLDGPSDVSVVEPAQEVTTAARNALVMIVDFEDATVSCTDDAVAQ